jgi:hypothetical protein
VTGVTITKQLNEYRLVQPVHVEDGAYKAGLDSLMHKVDGLSQRCFIVLIGSLLESKVWRCRVNNELIALVIRLKAGAAALTKQPIRGRIGQRATLL